MNDKYILFLKYAIFKNGTKEELFAMKQAEIDLCGKMFWGYGGFDALPERDIVPFIKLANENGEKVKVLFCKTQTFIKEDYVRGQEISADNKTFEKLPKGITMHGNKFSFIMDNLKQVDYDLNLFNYSVANGKHKDEPLAHTIKGYKNKELGIKNNNMEKEKLVKITFEADLLDCVYAK